jgi:aspartate racemase
MSRAKVIGMLVCQGIVREESPAVYRAVIGGLVESGAEGVVLGCTEIKLLISDAESPVPLFPTTRLHVEAAVDAALEGVDMPTAKGDHTRQAPTLTG